jgi:hypothetical protein
MIMIRELIDTELEVVAGGNGPFDFTAISQYLTQHNDVHQNAFALGFNATAVNAVGSLSNSASQVAVVG